MVYINDYQSIRRDFSSTASKFRKLRDKLREHYATLSGTPEAGNERNIAIQLIASADILANLDPQFVKKDRDYRGRVLEAITIVEPFFDSKNEPQSKMELYFRQATSTTRDGHGTEILTGDDMYNLRVERVSALRAEDLYIEAQDKKGPSDSPDTTGKLIGLSIAQIARQDAVLLSPRQHISDLDQEELIAMKAALALCLKDKAIKRAIREQPKLPDSIMLLNAIDAMSRINTYELSSQESRIRYSAAIKLILHPKETLERLLVPTQFSSFVNLYADMVDERSKKESPINSYLAALSEQIAKIEYNNPHFENDIIAHLKDQISGRKITLGQTR